jgi:hypothetical protein
LQPKKREKKLIENLEAPPNKSFYVKMWCFLPFGSFMYMKEPKERKKEKPLGGTPSTSSHRNFYLGELLNFQLVLSLLFLG